MKRKKNRVTTTKLGNSSAAPQWLVDAFQAAGNCEGDDDCPICRAMREHTDPSSVETIRLADGTTFEIVAIKPDVQ